MLANKKINGVIALVVGMAVTIAAAYGWGIAYRALSLNLPRLVRIVIMAIILAPVILGATKFLSEFQDQGGEKN